MPSGTLRLGRLRTATTADEVAFYWQTPVGSSALWQPEQHAQHTLNTEYHGKYDSLSRLRERDSDPGAHARLFYLSHLRGAQLRRVAGGAGKRGTVDRVRKGSRKQDNGEVTPTAIGREARQPWRTGAPLALCQTDKAFCPLL